MKLNKKLLIFLLSLVMLVSTLTVAAFAADGAAVANDDLAFTYLDTKTGETFSVNYQTDCGGTAAGVGEKFHELFADPASAYVITMYKDMTLSKAVPFGPLTLDRETDEHNRDFFKSFVNGSIVWDLNGTTVTVGPTVTGLVKMGAANCKLTATGAGATYSGDTFFGFEGSSTTNTFTLKSSVPGGKIVNESSAHLFGTGEGKKTKIFFEGENLTIVSPKGLILNSGEVSRDYKPEDVLFGVDGGTYICGSSTAVFKISRGASIKNATVITTSASVAQLINLDGYRTGALTLENVIFSSANAAAVAFKPVGSSNAYTATVTDCIFRNTVPSTTATSTQLSEVTYNGVNLTNTEANLAVIHASAPEGTEKYTFKFEIPKSDGSLEAMDFICYASASSVFTVTYGAANVTKTYLVGKKFASVPMDSAYYTVTVDIALGTVNIPEVWENVPADGVILDASYGGQTITVAPKDNLLPLAFVLYDETAETYVYAFADSNSIIAELVAALSAQANAATLYVYSDLTAPALTFAKDTIVELNDATLTMGGAITVSEGATLSVKGGEVLSAVATPFVVNGTLSLSASAKIYLSNATVVFGGAGTVTCENVNIYNLASASMAAEGVSVTLSDVNLMGVALGANVTVGGTVLGTEGTFAGNTYAEGVISGIIVNNKTETVTVLGQTYTVAYTEAATNNAAKAITLTYTYQDVVRGTQKYYYGSIANFHKELTTGYYFEYVGEVALTESATIECTFHADASKLKAQVILTDALNYIYYLRVEAAGVLQNLTLNGKTLDLAALEQTLIEEKSYYVIPVTFETFADALGNCELSVDLVNGDESFTVTASAALHDYLGTLLATSNETVAKQAYAVAGYVSALVSHFDYTFAFGDVRMKNLGRINNLLADYAEYKVEADLPAESEISSAYVKSVVLVADEKVTFAFRVDNNFDGSIEIGGVAAVLSKPFEGFDRLYATTTVSLADLGEEITLTVKNAEGVVLETMTYSLEDYVCGVTAQNEGTAAAYAKALWNLASVLG